MDKSSDNKKNILDRFDALRKLREYFKGHLGDQTPYTKAQYGILEDFILALGGEIKARLHPKLDDIWKDDDDNGERWQDESLGRIIYDFKNLSADLIDKGILAESQKELFETFKKTLLAESLRLREKLHGKCHRCDKVNERNGVIVISFMNDKYERIKPDEIICRECDWNEKMKKFEENGELTSTLVTEAYLFKEFPREAKDYRSKSIATLKKIADQCEEIDVAARKFEEKIWLPWLQKFMADSSERRFSANNKHLKVLVFAGLGRVLITIQDQFPMKHKEGIYNGGSISLKVSEGSKTPGHMGWQGIAATKDEAIRLFDDAIKLTTPETLKYDKDVSFLGM